MNENLIKILKQVISSKQSLNINLDPINLNNLVTVSGLVPSVVRNKFKLRVEIKILDWNEFQHVVFTHIAFKPLRVINSTLNNSKKIDYELIFSQCINNYFEQFGLNNIKKDNNGIKILNVEIQNK